MFEQLLPSLTTLGVTAMVCGAGLHAWHGWLGLRRLELGQEPRRQPAEEDVGMRIEMAAMRERVKKLEAIASGVEL
ncbi:hypothetical protein [Sphingosinicella terrae]|jgi:hypothetical protein|uniref:hypothetical protein n=1 Tax=Sphingosinicella terrae TaxID=2172047 RepID=UPI000E0D9B68|nr:hypothetical protein [Sphingosinicella terrae]